MKYITFSRKLRHFVLFFAVGFSWGYVGKTIVNKYMYTGFDDPQVIESRGSYDVKKIFSDDFSSNQSEVNEDLLQEEQVPEGKDEGGDSFIRSI